MTGPASSIDFLLNAQNVADLTDRTYVDALAQADAELAVKVANEKNRLVALEAELERNSCARSGSPSVRGPRREKVVALFEEQQSLGSTQEQLLAVAERAFKRTEESYEDWLAEKQARPATRSAAGSGAEVPRAPFDHVFEVCPVRRAARLRRRVRRPRYAGGYHPHKGVDIVAPPGTGILAPFDGQSFTSSNGLGGSVVFVVGS